MKLIIYYGSLFILAILLTGFIIQYGDTPMSMPQMASFCILLIIYVVGVSVVGHGKAIDERETHHRYLAGRNALIFGTITLSIGILYQLFISHKLDYWILLGLVVINASKIASLIYLNHKN